MDETTALLQFRLAPLQTRRDMAMLGVLHRTVLGKGPVQIRRHFAKGSNGNLVDPREEFKGHLIKRSAFGLVAVYNRLPSTCRQQKSVKEFQRQLQLVITELAKAGCNIWKERYSPRKLW